MKKINSLIISIACTANLLCANDSSVVSNCQADFTYSYDLAIMCLLPCAPIQFTDNSWGNADAVNWFWDFGDGYTSDEQNPLHVYNLTYNSDGTSEHSEMMVCLRVFFADSCISEMCQVVPLYPEPEKCYVYFRPYRNDSLSAIPEIIPYSFDVQAPENTVQWQWDFGDGTTSNDPNPVHGYDFQGGVFTVCLTIVTADSCTQSYCTEVYVGSGNDPDCQASFTYSVLYSYPPQYAFTDLSSGEVTEWFWDFGDGSYSSESNPVHVFMGKQWFDSLTPGNTDASGGVINDTVPPDGSLMFYYPFAYIYTVCLTITTADGCIQTYCSEVYVDSGNNSDCQARFIYRVLESYPLQYVFSDASSGFPVEWFWDFGDGTYGTDSSVVHVFSNQIWNGGTYPDSTDPSTGVIYDSIAPDNYYMPIIPGNNYQVCLTIITANGCSSTYCEWISSPYDTIINPDPCNYRIKLSTSNILGIPCSGTATASLYDPTFGLDVPASVYWSTGTYGDYVGGLCANMPYYVILTSGGGCTVAGSFAVMDYSVPVYTFGYWSYSGIGNDYRFAYNTPDSSYECYWDFGNGVILEGDAVDYTITEDMTDPVNLTVYDADGNLVHSEQIKVSFEPTGLTEPAVNLFRIYPNPVSDVLYLELGENNYDFVDLTVFDMTGKTVRTHRLPGNNYEPYSIDVSDLAGGIYLARVMYGSRMLGSEKFMK